MRNKWRTQLIAPAIVALCAACGGGDGRNQERQVQQPQTNAPEAQAQATVSLSGCVEAAPGAQQYVLRNVRFEPRGSGEPNASTTTSGAHGITEGAWVRLHAGEQNLGSHAGQRVRITGVIVDNGQNTIGTAGSSGTPNVAGDKSQAASPEHHSDKVKAEAGRMGRESMADGTAAQIRVQQVQASGERCLQESGK